MYWSYTMLQHLRTGVTKMFEGPQYSREIRYLLEQGNL